MGYPLGFGAGKRGLGDTFRVDGGDTGTRGLGDTLGQGDLGTPLGLMGGTLPFRFWGWDKALLWTTL